MKNRKWTENMNFYSLNFNASRRRLFCDQIVTNHIFDPIDGFFLVSRQFYPAFQTATKMPLAPTPGQNLSLHDIFRGFEVSEFFGGLVGGTDGNKSLDGQTMIS